MPKVNPKNLVWARETAALTLEAAARKLGLRDSKGASAAEKLAAMEAGEKDPSRSTLLQMERSYHRPLLAFYLSKPPWREDRGSDYRTLHSGRNPLDEARLDALVRNVRARQSMMRSALEEAEEAEPHEFVASHTMADDQPAVLASLRRLLAVAVADYRAERYYADAFALLRRKAEAAGIFVLVQGDLGSHHSRMEVDVFRGIAISDAIAPFVVINSNDSPAAWSFTLLHEITHLLLGQTGFDAAQSDRREEHFCDDIAGEFLFPIDELRELQPPAGDSHSLSEWINKIADARNLSRTLVAYRMYRAEWLTATTYRDLREQWRVDWLANRKARRERARQASGGPSYYTVKRHRLGRRMTETVHLLWRSDVLSTTRAGRILDVNPSRVGPLLEMGASS